MNLFNKNLSDVSIHFNQKDHSLDSHFKWHLITPILYLIKKN
jgi:hypothetical protein